jgi:hypothetical protein
VRVHLINPSEISFGTAVITPRWLYVLAAATPPRFGNPILVDETLEAADPDQFRRKNERTIAAAGRVFLDKRVGDE